MVESSGKRAVGRDVRKMRIGMGYYRQTKVPNQVSLGFSRGHFKTI